MERYLALGIDYELIVLEKEMRKKTYPIIQILFLPL